MILINLETTQLISAWVSILGALIAIFITLYIGLITYYKDKYQEVPELNNKIKSLINELYSKEEFPKKFELFYKSQKNELNNLIINDCDMSKLNTYKIDSFSNFNIYYKTIINHLKTDKKDNSKLLANFSVDNFKIIKDAYHEYERAKNNLINFETTTKKIRLFIYMSLISVFFIIVSSFLNFHTKYFLSFVFIVLSIVVFWGLILLFFYATGQFMLANKLLAAIDKPNDYNNSQKEKKYIQKIILVGCCFIIFLLICSYLYWSYMNLFNINEKTISPYGQIESATQKEIRLTKDDSSQLKFVTQSKKINDTSRQTISIEDSNMNVLFLEYTNFSYYKDTIAHDFTKKDSLNVKNK